MKPGRPARKKGKAAATKNLRERKRYQSLSVEERQAIVQRRDKSAQRKADAKRLATHKAERTAYHREQGRAVSKTTNRATDCQWPGCEKKSGLQLHHQGRDYRLCRTHHAAARARMNQGKGALPRG